MLKNENIKNIEYKKIAQFFIKNIIFSLYLSFILIIIALSYVYLKGDKYLIEFNFKASQISSSLRKESVKGPFVNYDHYTNVELNLKNPSIYKENTLLLCGYYSDRSGRVGFVNNIYPLVSTNIENPAVRLRLIVSNAEDINKCTYSIFEDFKNVQILNFMNSVKKNEYIGLPKKSSDTITDIVKGEMFIEPIYPGPLPQGSIQVLSKGYIQYIIYALLLGFFLGNAIPYVVGKK